MFCKNCGKQIDDQTRFCPNCGADAQGGNSSVKVHLNLSHGRYVGYFGLACALLIIILMYCPWIKFWGDTYSISSLLSEIPSGSEDSYLNVFLIVAMAAEIAEVFVGYFFSKKDGGVSTYAVLSGVVVLIFMFLVLSAVGEDMDLVSTVFPTPILIIILAVIQIISAFRLRTGNTAAVIEE